MSADGNHPQTLPAIRVEGGNLHTIAGALLSHLSRRDSIAEILDDALTIGLEGPGEEEEEEDEEEEEEEDEEEDEGEEGEEEGDEESTTTDGRRQADTMGSNDLMNADGTHVPMLSQLLHALLGHLRCHALLVAPWRPVSSTPADDGDPFGDTTRDKSRGTPPNSRDGRAVPGSETAQALLPFLPAVHLLLAVQRELLSLAAPAYTDDASESSSSGVTGSGGGGSGSGEGEASEEGRRRRVDRGEVGAILSGYARAVMQIASDILEEWQSKLGRRPYYRMTDVHDTLLSSFIGAVLPGLMTALVSMITVPDHHAQTAVGGDGGPAAASRGGGGGGGGGKINTAATVAARVNDEASPPLWSSIEDLREVLAGVKHFLHLLVRQRGGCGGDSTLLCDLAASLTGALCGRLVQIPPLAVTRDASNTAATRGDEKGGDLARWMNSPLFANGLEVSDSGADNEEGGGGVGEDVRGGGRGDSVDDLDGFGLASDRADPYDNSDRRNNDDGDTKAEEVGNTSTAGESPATPPRPIIRIRGRIGTIEEDGQGPRVGAAIGAGVGAAGGGGSGALVAETPEKMFLARFLSGRPETDTGSMTTCLAETAASPMSSPLRLGSLRLGQALDYSTDSAASSDSYKPWLGSPPRGLRISPPSSDLTDFILGAPPPLPELQLTASAEHMQELARQKSTLIRRKLAANVESVNSAERAVAAAMVKHSGFVALARRFARAFASSPVKGDTPKPPFGLLKLWRSARRARKWVKLKKDSHIVRGGIADYDKWANTVKERALFLLELRPNLTEALSSTIFFEMDDSGVVAAVGEHVSPARGGGMGSLGAFGSKPKAFRRLGLDHADSDSSSEQGFEPGVFSSDDDTFSSPATSPTGSLSEGGRRHSPSLWSHTSRSPSPTGTPASPVSPASAASPRSPPPPPPAPMVPQEVEDTWNSVLEFVCTEDEISLPQLRVLLDHQVRPHLQRIALTSKDYKFKRTYLAILTLPTLPPARPLFSPFGCIVALCIHVHHTSTTAPRPRVMVSPSYSTRLPSFQGGEMRRRPRSPWVN